ncbi:MAG: hypothetical protein CMI95_05395 [Pelagibacteraceae bacterium]|nr:hypothetical protein [Pelagibacteraceae bacterium]PPR51674.1 MAG: Farnesyl diphosphate synthase [Alphaproteobacteria bacterium MarineAlpha5_Bin10]|tara:strand:+ start:356 stop:1243 length:888 start_codon:yes stop_codon:yes gene_type:complete
MNKIIDKEIIIEKQIFDNYFKVLLSKKLNKSYLDKVMLYGTLNGGKRIRPYLIKQFSLLKNVKSKSYLRLAASVEIIHSYSLIHDDLPSMDNDNFRRGKPSVHYKYNEAQAILAGDSLHDLAFEILSDQKMNKNPLIRSNLVYQLSKSLGAAGLAGGQSLDLLFENKNAPISKIKKMYEMKTGALFNFCCTGPFIISKANKKEIDFAKRYGQFFGLIFQIVDDFMDVYGNKSSIGKTPGKDAKQKKSTILKHLNSKKLNIFCKKISSEFIKSNEYYLHKWPKLKLLIFYLIDQLD